MSQNTNGNYLVRDAKAMAEREAEKFLAAVSGVLAPQAVYARA